jgi:cytochrome c6
MSKLTRNSVAAIVVMLLAGTVSFAQSSGEATYKAKCQMCHGEKGLADSGAGKVMKVKPATDPDVKKLGEVEMIDAVHNGSGKMQAYKDKLTEAQIKDAVEYFRTFVK